MGQTATWNVYYDNPNDIAKGRQQAQKLAESADSAITRCRAEAFTNAGEQRAQAISTANTYTDRQVLAAKVERNTQLDLVNNKIDGTKTDLQGFVRTEIDKRAAVPLGPDRTWYTYVDAATLPAWPLASAPNNSIIFLYAINSGTAWNVAVEAGQFYVFNKDSKGGTHYAQISNPYSLTRVVPFANDVVTFFTAESSSTKKVHERLAEAEATIAGLKAEITELKTGIAELKKKQA